MRLNARGMKAVATRVGGFALIGVILIVGLVLCFGLMLVTQDPFALR
jgi:hypothetical protein